MEEFTKESIETSWTTLSTPTASPLQIQQSDKHLRDFLVTL